MTCTTRSLRFALLYIFTFLLVPLPATATGDTNSPRVEVAFVLDTTGSMSGLLEGAKAKIWDIANVIVSAEPTPDVRFGLVGYRDRGDTYITQVRQSIEIDTSMPDSLKQHILNQCKED